MSDVPSKRDLIAATRAKSGVKAAPAASAPAPAAAPALAQASQVPAVVRRALEHPVPPAQAAPAARAPAAQPAAQPARPAPTVRPAQTAVGPVARAEGTPEQHRLNIEEIGVDLRRIARSFGNTRTFQGQAIIVTIEVSNDPNWPLGISVTGAIPGIMHPRYVADGVKLNEVTAKLMRRLQS